MYSQGHEFTPQLKFLGRCGVLEYKNLKIGYFSGKDYDMYLQDDNFINRQVEEEQKIQIQGLSSKGIFTGSVFSKKYLDLLDKDKIDILIGGQLPFGFYEGTEYNPHNQEVYYNMSPSFATLSQILNPRYIFCSSMDKFYQRVPYINNEKYFSRIIHLGSIPGREKSQDSKEKYLHGVQITPISQMCQNELYDTSDPHTSNPFQKFINLYEGKIELGRELLKQRAFTPKQKGIYSNNNLDSLDQEDERVIVPKFIYATNLHHKADYYELKDFLSRWGNIQNLNMIKDRKGRFKGKAIVEYQDDSEAQQAQNDSDRYQFMGRRVQVKPKTLCQNSQKQQKQEPDCWFCYDNPQIEREFIFGELNDLYVALAKGPINKQHFLIIPKAHTRSYIELSESGQIEYQFVKQKLMQVQPLVLILFTNRDYLLSKGLDYLIFERNNEMKYQNAQHMNVQVIGIDPQKVKGTTVEDKISKIIESAGYQFDDLQDRDINSYFNQEDPAKFYFYLEFSGLKTAKGRQKRRLISKLGSGEQFELQFGRILACEITGERHKIKWKQCELSNSENNSLVKELKGAISFK